MAFPYDRRAARQRHVPIEVARELRDGRDRALRQVRELEKEADRLSARVNTVSIERDALELRAREAEERAEAAEEEVARLREELEEARQHTEPKPEEADRDDEVDEDLVERLQERVRSLTDDVSRIRSRTNEAVEAARHEERNRVLAGLGDVLDSVERGLDVTDEESPWREGLRAIRSQIHAFMRSEGAELIGTLGEELDPRFHEAVDAVEADEVPAGTIVGVQRQGILLDDGTIARPAQVVVAR